MPMVHVIYDSADIMTVALPVVGPVGRLGPYLLGVVLDFFFLGVLSCQVGALFGILLAIPERLEVEQKLGRYLCRFICVVLSVFKAILSVFPTWDINIAGFWDRGRAGRLHWAVSTQPMTMVLLSTAAQTYFVWRCFNLTGRNWFLLTFLGSAMSTLLALSIALCSQLLQGIARLPKRWFTIPLLALGLGVDIVITVIVLRRLLRARESISKTNDAFVKNWVTITWQCALPPALSQAVNLCMFILGRDLGVWHVLCSMITPRLYVFSLMYALNARGDIPVNAYAETGNVISRCSGISERRVERRGFERTDIVTLSTFKAKERVSTL